MADRLEQTIEIAAPRERVFRALTNAAELCTWWTTGAESDPRAGGAFAYDWEFHDASRNHRQAGRYREVEEGRTVAYPWEAGGETLVTFRLEDAGDGATRLELVHQDFRDAGARDHHDAGWAGFLQNLKSVLEGGEDRRGAMGLKVPAAR